MKRILAILVLMLICSSLFAVYNFGDYAIDDVKDVDPTFTSFFKYLKDNDYLNQYEGYGIFLEDDAIELKIADSFDYYAIISFPFESNHIDFERAYVVPESAKDVLKTINEITLQYAPWFAVNDYFDIFVQCEKRLSKKGITERFLAAELDMFVYLSEKIMTEIQKSFE